MCSPRAPAIAIRRRGGVGSGAAGTSSGPVVNSESQHGVPEGTVRKVLYEPNAGRKVAI